MEEYIAADPIQFEHHNMFMKLQTLSLEWRLNDPFASLVSFINLIFQVERWLELSLFTAFFFIKNRKTI